MHLCEMGQKGEPLPDPLPISLVPPSLRRAFTAANGSAAGTPGSVTSAPGSVMIMKFVSRALIGHLLRILLYKSECATQSNDDLAPLPPC